MAISGDVQLSVYNEALRILGERRLATLSENREPRRVLDDAWGAGEAVRFCLGKADWSFALRSSILQNSPDVTPAFGWRYAFAKPDDVLRLTALAANESLSPPLTAHQFSEEAGFWLSDYDVLYARWVSDVYGMDSGLWPVPFRKYLGAYLADECCERITNATTKGDRAKAGMRDALSEARSQNAIDQGVKFLPPSSWVRSRNSLQGRNR